MSLQMAISLLIVVYKSVQKIRIGCIKDCPILFAYLGVLTYLSSCRTGSDKDGTDYQGHAELPCQPKVFGAFSQELGWPQVNHRLLCQCVCHRAHQHARISGIW